MDKDRKRQAVVLLLEYRQELLTEVASVDKVIQEMSDTEIVKTVKTDRAPVPETPKHGDNANIWLTMTIQDAVIKFLQLHPDEAYRASEIGKFVKSQNVPGSEKKSFASMIATSVRRLAEKDKVLQTTVRIKEREIAAFQHKSTDS